MGGVPIWGWSFPCCQQAEKTTSNYHRASLQQLELLGGLCTMCKGYYLLQHSFMHGRSCSGHTIVGPVCTSGADWSVHEASVQLSLQS